MEKLKLLFIVPHYNNAKKLKRCVESILQNTSNEYDFKILIIDDFSRAEIRNSLKYFEEIKNTLVIYLSENKGVSTARNSGLNYAIRNQFTHLTFVDCDDHLINKIQVLDFNEPDLTIYESIETNDLYELHNQYNNFIIKINTNDIYDWREILLQYSIRPNSVRVISSCWGKIYSLEPIIKNKLFFNTKMNTFEDVHFLLRFLLVSRKVCFQKVLLYVHTNNNSYTSETFGGNRSPNALFSFLMLPNILKKLFNKFDITEVFNRHHFLACYYSIGFIRSAINRNNISGIIGLYTFIRRRLQSTLVRKCFFGYNSEVAGGRLGLKVMILLNMPLALTISLIYIARKRYQ
ncbi:glycosyltransferase family 2 protein [Polynucleobacter paneuropaeus]|nr:glycosyltransferase family 2 protein [Polynucleobacter paneuropaeus]